MTGLEATRDDRGVVTLTLRRERAGNAIDQSLADCLESAAADIAADPAVRVVVIRSTGSIFCAGGDVRGMANAADRGEFLSDLAGAVHRALVTLDGCAVPIVAAVQGPAAGAGLGLVLAADHVVAASSSSFVTAYSGVGLSPDCGVSTWLPRAVGLRRAMRMLLTNERLDAPTALDWGLVDRVVDDADLEPATTQAIEALLAGPHPALGETRRLVRSSYTDDFAAHLDAEAAAIVRSGRSAEAADRLSRFADG